MAIPINLPKIAARDEVRSAQAKERARVSPVHKILARKEPLQRSTRQAALRVLGDDPALKARKQGG
eukprot:1665444-Prymnesium_polylepis.1